MDRKVFNQAVTLLQKIVEESPSRREARDRLWEGTTKGEVQEKKYPQDVHAPTPGTPQCTCHLYHPEKCDVPAHRNDAFRTIGHYAYEGVKWSKGDPFQYRVYVALLLLDRKAAKEYFFTTVG